MNKANKQWLVKDFGTLTGVSVRTLHHYDKIGLLKPSLRLPNGYRLYSESDLLKLETIIALKFFGLDLATIKKLMRENVYSAEHFLAQKKLLQEQVKQLNNAITLLDTLITKSRVSKSIDLNNIIKLIKVYRMYQDLKKTWAGNIFNEEQLKQFAQLRQKYSDEEMKDYENRWRKLIAEVEKHVHEDPTSPIGKAMALKWKAMADEMYGDYPELQETMKEAYWQDKIPNVPFDKEVGQWIKKAWIKYIKKEK